MLFKVKFNKIIFDRKSDSIMKSYLTPNIGTFMLFHLIERF